MDTSSASEPCWLLNLPDELKLHIVQYVGLSGQHTLPALAHRWQLDKRRDLYNLSRTCRVWEAMTMARLYHNVDVEIPPFKTRSWDAAPLPVLRAVVTQSVRELSIRPGLVDQRNPLYTRRRRSHACSDDPYVSEVLLKVPPHRLISFSYLPRTPLTRRMLDLLTTRHESHLRALRFYELEPFWDHQAIFPRTLTSLECRSVNEGEGLSKMMLANRHTLTTLGLGQERQLVEQYQQSRIGFLEEIPQPLECFSMTIQLHILPHLRELALYGLDVTSLVPSSTRQALLFCNLHSLTLESCLGSTELLESMAATFHFAQNSPEAPQPRFMPQLQHFLFRHEAPTMALKSALTRALSSFTGLRTLSVLLENATVLERPSTLIAGHGPTLTTLVLECRIQPREHLSLDTSRPFGVGGHSQELWQESMDDICRLCPNLVELGMGFPWNDELVRLRKTGLPALTKLRTIHIRNFPENNVLSQLGDYTIKESATKFVEWVFPALVGGGKPSLETLAIGPTLYESRWKSSTVRRQPPEFLRTHHYCLDWAKTRFGRWSPLITAVTEKYMEEVRGEKPLGGVFEQVWLK